MLRLVIEGVASSDIVGWEAHCVFTYTSFISLFPPFIAMCKQLHVMDSNVSVYCLHTKLECIVYFILLFTRGEAIMLINWSIIFLAVPIICLLCSQILPIIRKMMLDNMHAYDITRN